ncbi:hypothetical protein EHS13_22220 [Paenibacillus psychroresistens]|uniref:YhaN AAA domain-containing protein n=1 Tax=Paenibacillus psychroresistens TaxID=1778678 RepID=A0A6B8RPU9_9BACL|nr:AAA family ATPase [Paenibacillus psychroresistens]QGQ97406.1 hypothetical protein EHS13_22220 [Paenibacillus psychroresistens]
MKLRTIHVEGFGLLRDKTLQLEGPLTLLYGRNEAGKSTLMGFIRAVLFGFPARASGAGSLEPLMGGAHGGYLTLETTEGERIRVERREGASASAGRGRAPGGGHVRVTLASGAQGGAELLQPLLGGITGELFRSLFAFSLGELQEVRTLQSDALSGYLYSAGLGARGDTIMAAERKLTLEMEQLFRPRGRNQALNLTLLKLEEQEADIRRSKEQAGRYNDYLAEMTSLDERILELDHLMREQRSELTKLETAEQARSHWQRGNEIRTGLMDLRAFEVFPEDAMNRFNELTKAQELLLIEQDKHQLMIEQLSEEMNAIQIDPDVLLHQTELDELYEQLTVYRIDQDSAKELSLEVEQQRLQLDRLLRQIAGHWNESILEEFAVTVALREQVRRWDAELEQLQQEREFTLSELQRMSIQMEEAKEKANRLENKLLLKKQMVFGELTLDAQQEMDTLTVSIPQLRKQLQMRQQLRLELRHLEQLGGRVQSVEAENSTNTWLHSAFRWFCMGACLILPVYFILQKQPIGAVISFISLLIISLGVWVYTPKAQSSVRAKRVFPTGIDKLEQDLMVIDKALYQRMEQLVGLAEIASASSFNSKALTDQQLDESIDQLQQASDIWREGKRELLLDEQKWQEAADNNTKLQMLNKTILNKQKESLVKLAEATTGWQVWLTKNQLAIELSPKSVLEILQLIESGQQQLQQKQRNQAKYMVIHNRITEYEHNVLNLMSLARKEDIQLALRSWKETAEHTAQSLINRNRLEQQLTQTQSQQLLHRESLERIQKRILDLWQEAESQDETHFRLHVRQNNERMAYKEELRQIDVALDVFMSSTRKDQLDGLLSELTSQELIQKMAEGDQTLLALEREVDQLKDRRGKLRSELEKLEQGAEHSERLQHIEQQKAVLTEQAGQWAKAAFCASLFRKARELYERERQPGVLLLATEYFQTITSGEYLRVRVPIGEKKIIVEHASGRMMDSSLLSRGTAEQLYLAMRFALAEEYARKASLPLILDDILVNFDKERMRQTLVLLAEISAKHQVIFFTCHRHVADAFSEQIPAHQQILL